MALLALSFPIPAGKTERWEKFVKDLNGPRSKEFKASRKRMGVRERTFLQRTPMGDFVIVTLRGKDPAGAFEKFGKGKDAFTKWFLAEVKEIHGLDLSAPPPGPMPEMVIDSDR